MRTIKVWVDSFGQCTAPDWMDAPKRADGMWDKRTKAGREAWAKLPEFMNARAKEWDAQCADN